MGGVKCFLGLLAVFLLTKDAKLFRKKEENTNR
jgi:hypothetical protein